MTRTMIAAAAALALSAAATGLQAQASPPIHTTVNGPIITTGDVAGGMFAPDNGHLHPTAMDRAAAAITTRLTFGGLADPVGETLPLDLQITLRRALHDDAAALAALVEAIPVPAAAALQRSLRRILAEPEPGQLGRAVADFNRVVDTADAAVLAEPPAEFLAVHAVLHALIAAAIDASR